MTSNTSDEADGTDDRTQNTMPTTVKPDKRTIREQLDKVIDPCSAARGTDLGLVEMGLVKDVAINNEQVQISLRLTGPGCMQIPYFVEQVSKRIGDLQGVSHVSVTTDAGLEWTPEMMSESGREKREKRKQALRQQYKKPESDIS